jgi:hypothetical protein
VTYWQDGQLNRDEKLELAEKMETSDFHLTFKCLNKTKGHQVNTTFIYSVLPTEVDCLGLVYSIETDLTYAHNADGVSAHNEHATDYSVIY